MAENKKAAAAKISKKDARHLIEQKLASALAHLKPQLGEKKFKRRIKEAGKLIMHGVELPKTSTTSTVKKAAAKAPVKKAEKVSKKKKTKK